MPNLGAALDRANEARMLFETHAMTVAQDAVAVWALLLLIRGTRQTADILPTLRLVVIAIGVTQTTARGIGRAVLIVATIQQGGLIDVLVAPVVSKDGDGAMILEPLVVDCYIVA